MKKIILLIAVLLTYNLSYSQLQLGLRAGVSSASYNAGDFTDGEYMVEKSKDAQYGYHIGLFGQIKLLSLFVQPELLLSTISNKYDISNRAGDVNVSKIDRTFNLDIPIMVGYMMGPIKLQAGPTARILLFNKSQLKDYTGYETQLKRASWAAQAGVGLQLTKLTVDLKYEFGLSKLGSGIKVEGEEYKFDSRVNQFVLSLGYFF
jgi:hypothetical protein